MKLPLLAQSEDFIISVKESIHTYFLYENTLSSCKKMTLLFTPHKTGILLFPELKIASFLPKDKNFKDYKIGSFPTKIMNPPHESTKEIQPENIILDSKILDTEQKEIVYTIFSPGILKKTLQPVALFFLVCSLFLWGVQATQKIAHSIKFKNLYFTPPQLSHNISAANLITNLEKQIQLFLQKNERSNNEIFLFTTETSLNPFVELQHILLVCQQSKYRKNHQNMSIQGVNSLFQEANLIAKKIELHSSL